MQLNRNEHLFINRQFFLFFISQISLNCGAYIQVIAIAQLLLKYTNSGLITGFSIVCAPLPGIILSLFSGSIGDRMQAKKILIFLDILRGFLAFQFIICKSALSIFIIMLLINFLDVVYSPAKNKLLISILSKDDLLKGNSILNGGHGVVSLITPIAVGFFINIYGIQNAFIANGFFYVLSSLLLSKISVTSNAKKEKTRPQHSSEIIEGIKYCLDFQLLKRLILMLAVIDFGTISVNIAFYSLAFDSLKVTSRYWGLLLSVLYGMNLFSMILIIRLKKWFKRNSLAVVNLFLTAVSFIWCFYSITDNLLYIILAVAVEGLSLSICNTLLTTKILEAARNEYTARVVGTRDLVSNFAKLTGISLTYLLLTFFKPNFIFITSASILFIYIVFRGTSLKMGYKQSSL